jgi:multidrug efflux pump subunit AcrA (membrane-fusion protein)
MEAFRGRVLEGNITRIASEADARSHIFEVEITLPNADGALKPGMIAALTLNQSQEDVSLTVLPLDAVVRSSGHKGRFAVFVVDETKKPAVARIKDVDLGELLGNEVTILGGLADKDRVVVRGAALLSDGEPVQVMP